MTRIRKWVVLNADGSVNCQPNIPDDRPPSEAGDNPGGLREFRVRRHGDLNHEHFDAEKQNWVSDKAKKHQAERRARREAMSRDELVEHIVEEVIARLKAEGVLPSGSVEIGDAE